VEIVVEEKDGRHNFHNRLRGFGVDRDALRVISKLNGKRNLHHYSPASRRRHGKNRSRFRDAKCARDKQLKEEEIHIAWVGVCAHVEEDCEFLVGRQLCKCSYDGMAVHHVIDCDGHKRRPTSFASNTKRLASPVGLACRRGARDGNEVRHNCSALTDQILAVLLQNGGVVHAIRRCNLSDVRPRDVSRVVHEDVDDLTMRSFTRATFRLLLLLAVKHKLEVQDAISSVRRQTVNANESEKGSFESSNAAEKLIHIVRSRLGRAPQQERVGWATV